MRLDLAYMFKLRLFTFGSSGLSVTGQHNIIARAFNLRNETQPFLCDVWVVFQAVWALKHEFFVMTSSVLSDNLEMNVDPRRHKTISKS